LARGFKGPWRQKAAMISRGIRATVQSKSSHCH
jgi:hypothetical protein